MKALEADTRDQAELNLKAWLKENKYWVHHWGEYSRWTYARPFWAVTITATNMSAFGNSRKYGFHIYDDGEVKLVCAGDT